MLRLGCQSSKGMVSRSPWLLGGRKPQPGVRHSSSGAGGRAKILSTTLAISAGTLGGVFGYSVLDPDFRKNIPGSAKLMAEEKAAAAEAERVVAKEPAAAEAAIVAAKEAAAAEAAMIAAEVTRIAEEEAEAAKIVTEEAAAAEAAGIAAEEAAVAEAARISADENAVSNVTTDPPMEKQEILASANGLPTVLDDPSTASEPEVIKGVGIPSLCKENAEAQASTTVLDIPVEKPKVLASSPELPAALEVSALLVETSDAPKQPSVIEVSAPPIENPEHLACAIDSPASATELSTVVGDPASTCAQEKPVELNIPSCYTEKPNIPVSAPELAEVLEVPALPTVKTSTPEVSAERGVRLPFVEETGLKENSIDEAAADGTVEFDTETDKENDAFSHITADAICPAEASRADTENNNLENLLLELCKEMQEMVVCAVSEYEAYSDATVTHINLMQKLLEVNLTDKDDTDWNEMLVAAQAKSDKAMAAERGEKEALVAITNLVDSINAGRMNKVTSINPELLVAEEAADRAIYQMDLAKDRRVTEESEDRVMEIYKDLVDAGREQFHKEMASIMPDVNVGVKNGKLTEYELNMFLTHSYKKVLILQQELAKQQILEQDRFNKALVEQKIKMETLATVNLEEEMDRQAMELQVEHEIKMTDIREETEGNMRSHLKRQAIAHMDHLTEMQTIQKSELTRYHDHQMADQVDSLTKTQADNLANVSGTVTGLTEALEARAASDSASLSAQTLWLACTSLNTTLTMGRMNGTTWEEKLQPLVLEVEQVKMAAGGEDKFVEVVLASISPIAMERGVYTEDSLKERFGVVEKVARRVTGIGEEGGSLLTYGLSFLQSLLVVNLAPIDTSEEVDFAKLSPTDLVNLARHSLECGNLARALQLMTQLTGEPGRVATDWVAEARLTLETRQAVQAILMYSQANSCKYMLSG